MADTCRVSIVVYGEKTREAKEFRQLVQNGQVDAYEEINVNDPYGGDPRESKYWRCNHQDDANCGRVQANLLNDEAFIGAVQNIVEAVIEHYTTESKSVNANVVSLSGVMPIICTTTGHDPKKYYRARYAVSCGTIVGDRIPSAKPRINQVHDVTNLNNLSGARYNGTDMIYCGHI